MQFSDDELRRMPAIEVLARAVVAKAQAEESGSSEDRRDAKRFVDVLQQHVWAFDRNWEVERQPL